jgi:hypothetical protein
VRLLIIYLGYVFHWYLLGCHNHKYLKKVAPLDIIQGINGTEMDIISNCLSEKNNIHGAADGINFVRVRLQCCDTVGRPRREGVLRLGTAG